MMHHPARANRVASKSLLNDHKNKLNLPLPEFKQQLPKVVTTRAQARRKQSPASSTKASTTAHRQSPRKSTSQTLQSTINPFSKSDRKTIGEHEEFSQLLSQNQSERKEIIELYKADIKEYLLGRQYDCQLDGSYLTNGNMITNKMRVYLVRHMFKIYNRFELLRVTLHVAVNYMDLYLSKKIVIKDQLQAITIAQACLFMAMKFEQIYPPDLSDWVDNRYRRDVLRMEAKILSTFDFSLSYQTLEHFLMMNSSQLRIKSEEKIQKMNTLADLSLFDMKIRQIPASELATAICSLIQHETPPDFKIGLSVKWMVQRNSESLLWLKQQRYYSIDNTFI